MQEFIQNSILPAVMKFVNTKAIRAIKDGIVMTMPLIIVGAVLLLLYNLPIESAQKAIEATGIVPYLSHGYTCSFGIVAIVAAISIAYTWAKNDGWEPLACGVIALSVFLILIPDYVGLAGLEPADGAIASVASARDAVATVGGFNTTWLGGQGMIAAIIAGLLTGWIYSMFLKADIRIKMPEGVPDGVAAAFTGLIPAAAMIGGATVIYGLVEALTPDHVTPVELIYEFIQTPLQGLGDSLPGIIVIEALIPFLWWFGVHGATVVGSVADPISLMNQTENAELFQRLLAENGNDRAAAIAALGPNGAHIFTDTFKSCFQAITGSGITMGLVIYMVFFAKSQQFRQVGKLGLGSGIFNINEPILFGTPIVMNPKLFIPFVIAPVLGNAGAYILTMIGFIPYTNGVTVPWTTPPILSGFICLGWQAALWQIIMIAGSFFIYLPFARSVDNDAYKMEQGEAA